MTNRMGSIPGFDEEVAEVKAYMEAGDDGPEAAGAGSGTGNPGKRDEIEMITIKFGRGLMGDPFTSRNGKELVEVAIPNSDPADKRPWQTFVLGAKSVHENKYGKGMWAKLPANGHTTLSRSVPDGEKNGKRQWKTEKTTVSNRQLKEMVEYYKQNRREPLGEQVKKATVEAGRSAGRDKQGAARNEQPSL